MAVTVIALTYACEFGDERGLWLERLQVSWNPEAGTYMPAPSIPRKARKQLSRCALFAIDAAQRLGGSFDRTNTAVFSACSTGREVALPFVFSASEAMRADERQAGLTEQGLVMKPGGHVVDYLRYSTGTLPGHVAKYAGLRGQNACFSGRSASFFALRKAVLTLESGRLSSAVVVGAESLDEAQLARAKPGTLPRELGVAVSLGHSRSSRGHQLSLRSSGIGHEPRYRHFEAIGDLARLAAAIENSKDEAHDLPIELPTGQRFRWSLDRCAAL